MVAVFILIVSGLVVLSVGIHLLVLRGISRIVIRWRAFPVPAMGFAVLGAILAHLAEIALFAVVLFWMSDNEEFGRLTGNVQQNLSDYFYYSAVTYTALGFGDVVPAGHMRLLSAVEALTGLVLIAWTASFGFFLMQQLWYDRSSDVDRTANR